MKEVSEPQDELSSAHACRYCGIGNPACVVKCVTCDKWFCNGRGGSSGSHIIHHLVRSKHKEVNLHPESPLGDSVLECYQCGGKNVFLLGFVPAKSETVVVLLCRSPCVSSVGKGGGSSAQDVGWDTRLWQPLIDDRMFLPWLVSVPSMEEEHTQARPVTSREMGQLEDLWAKRIHPVTTTTATATATATTNESTPVEEENVPPVQLVYENGWQYRDIFTRLIGLEADVDQRMKESQKQEDVSVRWDLSLNMKRVAHVQLGQATLQGETRVCPGDEVRLSHRVSGWSGTGYVVSMPPQTAAVSEEIPVQMRRSDGLPLDVSNGYTVEFVWKPTTYERMQAALSRFATDKSAMSSVLFTLFLGRVTEPLVVRTAVPKSVSVPSLPELNHSQSYAVKMVLQRPLSLIQGPPGTGKTLTSATLVYHLVNNGSSESGKVLVCAPSNVAVDHLTAQIAASGLRVVRVVARGRESLDNPNHNSTPLSLHELAISGPGASSELRKLAQLKEELGELSATDERTYAKLKRAAEAHVLAHADVICCTCVGAGDPRVASLRGRFRAVLIDEATQATEPETLIPLVLGAGQIVLVGDHQQLGPVVLSKPASRAGLTQSLFERLIRLGLRPVRLQVQYRSHPCLSEFPSNMFYEGSLQNGVTAADRTRPTSKSSTFPWPLFDIPMFFLAVIGTEEISASGTSYLNRAEAGQVERVVSRWLADGVTSSQIGVITPYEGQRAYVVSSLQSDRDGGVVEVASVDAFQGREKDYIVLSCVRSNMHQGLGFLSDPRRLNVALTRARYGLVILGNPTLLSRHPLWHALLTHFKEKGVFVEGSLSSSLRACTLPLSHPGRKYATKGSSYRSNGSVNQQGMAPHSLHAGTSSVFSDTASVGFSIMEDLDGGGESDFEFSIPSNLLSLASQHARPLPVVYSSNRMSGHSLVPTKPSSTPLRGRKTKQTLGDMGRSSSVTTSISGVSLSQADRLSILDEDEFVDEESVRMTTDTTTTSQAEEERLLFQDLKTAYSRISTLDHVMLPCDYKYRPYASSHWDVVEDLSTESESNPRQFVIPSHVTSRKT